MTGHGTDTLNQTFTLKDGRALGFAECGDAAGKAVFHFHASGSSRLEVPADEALLVDLGIRFITTDRPGHGLSDPQTGRKLLDWPDDVGQLADHLGIDRFYVMGWSAGGPPALACAYKLPERVLAGAVVSGLAPPERPRPYKGLPLANRLWMFGARRMPVLVRLMRRMAYPIIMSEPEEAGRNLVLTFPPEDRRLLESPEAQESFVLDIQEGYRQGWQGPVQDDIVNARPWGFRLEEIAVRIDLWHGEIDENVPLDQARYQHERISHSRLTIWPGQAHLALYAHWGEVLAMLVEQETSHDHNQEGE
jgi:pimeloyl-ACP methyl ester carboxylesterase